MNNRQELLIEYLKDNKWVTGRELSKIFGVSDRTIRSDIKSINSHFENKIIVSNTKSGYKLVRDLLPKNIKNESFDTPEKRQLYIIMKLLHHKDYSIFDIIDQLFVSETTLINDINSINFTIKNLYQTEIKREKEYIRLSGDERNIRKIYKNLLIQETKNNLYNINKIASLYKKFNLLKIKNLLEETLNEYDYYINEVDFPILMIHLGVTLDRIMSNKTIQYIKTGDYIKNSIEYDISRVYLKKVEKIINIDINQYEIIFFSKILISKCKISSNHTIIESKYKVIVKDLLKHIYENYGINFLSDEQLINGLCLHIEALIARVRIDSSATNLFLSEIKKNYPFIFELSLVSAGYLNKQLDLSIGEEEIGFICLHLGTAYEKLYISKYKAVLINPNFSAINNKIEILLRKKFSNKLEIIETLNYFQEDKVIKLKPDIIISTIPLNHKLKIKTIKISPFIKDIDEANILKAINNLEKEKLNIAYDTHLKKIISKENFYIDLNFNDKKDAIEFLCQNLLDKGYVNKGYFENVMKREEMSDTSFIQGFAIPHSLNTKEINKSCISIIILDKPLKWGSYEIKIIFLLTIKNVNSPTLKLFFNWMDNITEDISVYSKLIESKSYEEFIEIFSKQD